MESYASTRGDSSGHTLTANLHGIVRNEYRNIAKNSTDRLRRRFSRTFCFSDEMFATIETHLLERGFRFLLPSLAIKCGALREAISEYARKQLGLCTDSSGPHLYNHLNFESDRHIEKMAQRAIFFAERSLSKAFNRISAVQHILRHRCGIDMTKIDTIQVLPGDPHNGGAQPIIFSDKHVTIVYKPVDLRAPIAPENALALRLHEGGAPYSRDSGSVLFGPSLRRDGIRQAFQQLD